jgi:methanol dehydrogenase (cytochrome c) subunit 2
MSDVDHSYASTNVEEKYMTSRALTKLAIACGIAAMLSLSTNLSVLAYDGQHCKEPGVCWEPQPSIPEELAGSKYDVKSLEDPKEVAKQGGSERAMEERNRKRVEHFKKTGKFVYDVTQIPD